jgi:hypothetical protein
MNPSSLDMEPNWLRRLDATDFRVTGRDLLNSIIDEPQPMVKVNCRISASYRQRELRGTLVPEQHRAPRNEHQSDALALLGGSGERVRNEWTFVQGCDQRGGDDLPVHLGKHARSPVEWSVCTIEDMENLLQGTILRLAFVVSGPLIGHEHHVGKVWSIVGSHLT